MALRTTRPSPMASSNYSVWRAKPPGPEQIELERLFSSNEIDQFDSADSVHQQHEIFKKFSTGVFGSHFRTTKAKFGFAANLRVSTENNTRSKIPELGSSQKQNETPKLPCHVIEKNEEEVETNFPISFSNAPFSTWTYTDHAKKTDYLCVVVPIFSGSRDVKWSLSSDGMTVTIHYSWPSPVFKPSVLFQQAIADKTLLPSHPKMHAFASEMIEEGLTENSKPRGEITVNLPYKVKRETDSFKFEAMKLNGGSVAYLEFTAYQKSLFVDDADTTLNFD